MTQIEYNVCRCHTYNFESGKRTGKSFDMDLIYCDKYIAVSIDDWETIDTVLNKMRAAKKR